MMDERISTTYEMSKEDRETYRDMERAFNSKRHFLDAMTRGPKEYTEDEIKSISDICVNLERKKNDWVYNLIEHLIDKEEGYAGWEVLSARTIVVKHQYEYYSTALERRREKAREKRKTENVT